MESTASPTRPINIRKIRASESWSLSDDEDFKTDGTFQDDTNGLFTTNNEENTSKSLPDRVREILPPSGSGTVRSVVRLHVAIIPKHSSFPNLPHISSLVTGTQTVIQVPRLLPEPLEVIKTIIFDATSTVRQCIETIITKTAVSNELSDIEKSRQEYIDYGLYITRIGWLDEDELLDDIYITEHDLLEFRQQHRKVHILINTPQKEASNSLTIIPSQCESANIEISEKVKVGDAIKDIIDIIGVSKTFGRHQFNPEEVVEVDKDSYLLHLPLPPQTQFVIICKTVQISYSVSFPSLQFQLQQHSSNNNNNNSNTSHVDNLPIPSFNKDNYGLFFVVPYHHGAMFKLPGHVKLYNKWRKRFFILNKGKLSYYRHDSADPQSATSNMTTTSSGPSSVSTTTTSSDKSSAEEHKVTLQQFILQQPINFIAIQSVDSIEVVAKPFDNTSKKLFCFEMFTARKSYYFGTESVEEGQLWLTKLTEWVTFSKVFGPSTAPSTKTRKKTSEAIHDVLPVQVNVSEVTRRLSARMTKAIELVRKGSFGSKSQGNLAASPGTQTAAPVATTTTNQTTSTSKPERSFVEIPKQPFAETKVLYRTLTVELRDGSRKLVTVNESLEVYDLVEVIAKEIGTENCHFMTFLDQGDQRKVELLDHSTPLSAQNLPMSAVFLIKKTGIAQADTIQDNHFLYVQLPLIDGFVLKYYQTQPDPDKNHSAEELNNNNNTVQSHSTSLSDDHGFWQKQWVVLRSNKLFFFDYETSTHYNNYTELFDVQTVTESTAPENHLKKLSEKLKSLPQLLPRKSTTLATSTLNCEDCGLEIKSKKQTMFLMCKTKHQRDALVNMLNQWKNFFTDDGTKLTMKPSSPQMFIDFNSFFANNNPTLLQPVFYDMDTINTHQRRKSSAKRDSSNYAFQNNNDAPSTSAPLVFRSPLIDDKRSNAASRRKLTNAPRYPTSIISNLQ